MNKTKYLKGECQHCAGHLEFLAEHIGMRVPCPHCGQETELLLAQPSEQPSIPRRAIVWTVIAVVVLGVGLAAALIALQRARKWAENQKKQKIVAAAAEAPAENVAPLRATNSTAPAELQTSEVSLDRAQGSSLVYAVGTI